MSITHIALWVSDVEATERFYTDVLGLQKSWQSVDDQGVTNLYVTDADGFEIQFKHGAQSERPIDTAVIDHLALAVSDIHDAFRRVERRTDSDILQEPAEVDSRRGYDAKIALVTDPDGYTIEFVQKLE